MNEKIGIKRLNAVVKELNVGMKTLTEFLLKKGYYVEAKPTSKLTEEQYKLLLETFQSSQKIALNRIIECKKTKNNYLDLSDLSLIEIPKEIQDLDWLEILNLSRNNIIEIKCLDKLQNLYFLDLSNNDISEIKGLDNLVKIINLDLSKNHIISIKGLDKLIKIQQLNLSTNQIIEIKGLNKLKEIVYLNLAANFISEIKGLNSLSKITHLNLSFNELNEVKGIYNLKSIQHLNLSCNKLTEIIGLENLNSVKELYIDNNPLREHYNLILKDGENHWGIIKNILDRESEKENKLLIVLPAKILLFGNHGVGKSSLLHFLQNKNLKYEGKSTHILKIETYPKNNELPVAIFYDFGGQDYYHGLYQAFISRGSAYLLLWSNGRDNYDIIQDSNKQNTQNFKVEYWLSLKNHTGKNSFNSKKDPLLLIQTHAYKNETAIYNSYDSMFPIQNRFYVSLSEKYNSDRNDAALQYLDAEINSIIETSKITKQESKWYVDFYKYIINEKNTEAIEIETILNYYKPTNKNSENEVRESLIEELKQFHNQGLVLYYPDIDENLVWLNPEGLVQHIHDEILNTETLKKYNGKIPKETFAKNNLNLIGLLKKQKVLFEHDYGDTGTEYIIPNFLPLVDKNDPEYSLFIFGLNNPSFVLKFLNFIPVGLINQLICFYGTQPDKKKFWRNQLLFTFEKAKILIQLNFELLEIKVFSVFDNHSKQEENKIKSYLFYTIMSFYWDKKILTYPEFREATEESENNRKISIKKFDYNNSFNNIGNILFDTIIEGVSDTLNDTFFLYNIKDIPNDLYLSVDDLHFIKYLNLINHDEVETKTTALVIEKDRSFNSKTKEIAIKPFEIFTDKKLTALKKVFISYSKDDLSMVHRFRDAIVPLYDDGIIEHPWYCSFLEAGSKWDEEIQKQLIESDIVFFMCSISFLRTKYIKEYEIKIAKEYGKKIIPVILNFCEWENYLGDYSALPFIAKPVADFKNQDLAWHLITRAVRLSIKSNDKEELDKEIKKLYERLVEGKLDNNGS